MKEMSRKKLAVISLSVILAVGGTMGATYAILRKNSETAANTFAGAIVNVAVSENGELYESGSNTGYSPLEKNVPAAKSVRIKNKDTDQSGNNLKTTDTYVRVRLVPIFRNAKGGSVAADMSQIVYTYGDITNWKKQMISGEVYYYYTQPVAPGEETTELITAVAYTGDVPEGLTFELQVLTEGVAVNQKNSLSAWNLDGFGGLENL